MKGDPFELHLDRIFAKVELADVANRSTPLCYACISLETRLSNVHTASELAELPEHAAVGRVWADTVDSIPEIDGAANYYVWFSVEMHAPPRS